MTPKQQGLYFRKWGRVRSALLEFGGFSAQQAELERHAIHLEALGEDKSSKDFNNRDLDAVLDAFEDRLVILDGPRKERRSETQARARRIFAIEALGVPDAYIQKLARDQFHTSDWKQLSFTQLDRLRYTVTARSRSLKKRKANA